MRTTLALIFAATLSGGCGVGARDRDTVEVELGGIRPTPSYWTYSALTSFTTQPVAEVLASAGVRFSTFRSAGYSTFHVLLADRARAIAALSADPRTRDVEIVGEMTQPAPAPGTTAPTEAR